MNIMSSRSLLLLALNQTKRIEDRYGAKLIETVSEMTGGAVKLRDSTVYPELEAMENEFLIDGHERLPDPTRGGRPRRHYDLTQTGIEAWSDVWGALNALLKSGRSQAAQTLKSFK